MSVPAERAYSLAQHAVGGATFFMTLGNHDLNGCRMGYLKEATALVERLARAPGDFSIAFTNRAIYAGMAALSGGDLFTAEARCREAIALPTESVWIPRMATLSLATAIAMTGDANEVEALLAAYRPAQE